MSQEVKLVSVTPDAEKTMGFIARVSNPDNQNNPNVAGLLKYCIKHAHWSVFEQAHMTLEITTTRAISAQILRHRSFTFQEFSQRYAKVDLGNLEVPELRLQDEKNRQNSIEVQDMDKYLELQELSGEIDALFDHVEEVYNKLLAAGVAKECARNILPMCSPTTIYMTGNIRSWINYINLRSGNGTQKEHHEIALACKEIFKQQLPTVSEALGW